MNVYAEHRHTHTHTKTQSRHPQHDSTTGREETGIGEGRGEGKQVGGCGAVDAVGCKKKDAHEDISHVLIPRLLSDNHHNVVVVGGHADASLRTRACTYRHHTKAQRWGGVAATPPSAHSVIGVANRLRGRGREGAAFRPFVCPLGYVASRQCAPPPLPLPLHPPPLLTRWAGDALTLLTERPAHSMPVSPSGRHCP